MMKKTWKIAAVALTVVALGVGFSTVAFAAEDTDELLCAGPGAGFGMGGFGGFGGNSAVLTDLLSLTAEELYDLRADGKTLAEIAAAKGVSEDALVAAILAEREEVLAAAVEAGRLTPEQAELMLQNMSESIRLSITSQIGPRGFGGCLTGEVPAEDGVRAGFGGMGRMGR
ncbi:MAG: hypothetical protein P3T54_08455 [Dehalogenimonas sp.]|uniref:DUF2680 domain-containing protein n=1 Tax=Candidatus Dehalogenimonas loeffleri TaxID=3127115 RepID=A0ABZ2J1M0_9CHLR|nr:hypothetical protein [Dehalogenimonas sp.]